MYFSSNELFAGKQPSITAPLNSSSNGTNSPIKTGGPREEAGVIAGLVFFYTFVAFLALLSNISILITILRRYVARNTVNTFLCSLAVSDLFMVVLSMLDFVSFLSDDGWIFGGALCKIQSYILEISFSASRLTLVAVSVERYLLICHPYMKRRSIKVTYKILGCVWASACIICMPMLHGYGVIPQQVEGVTKKKCIFNNWDKKYEILFYFVYSCITYIIPFIVMAFAHWRIGLSVRENNGRRASAQSTLIKEKKSSVCYTIREEEQSSSSTDKTSEVESGAENGESANGRLSKAFLHSISGLSSRSRIPTTHDREWNRRKKRMKALRLLFVVTVTFFVLWTPFILLRLIREAGVDVNSYLYTFSEIFIFSSTAVNGFIYAFMSRPFRNAFKALLCCKSRRELASRDSGPSMSNSEDNRLSNKANSGSRASSVNYNADARNGSLPYTKVCSTPRTNGCAYNNCV